MDIESQDSTLKQSKSIVKSPYWILKCPITTMIMYEPVTASDGFVYEKEAIDKWLTMNRQSPVTRKTLNKELYPAVAIKNYINNYISENPHKKDKQYRPSNDHADNIELIESYVDAKRYEKLLEYKNFVVAKMRFEQVLVNCNDLKIIYHILDNEYINKDDNMDKSIHIACKAKRLDLVKYLVEQKGFDINCKGYKYAAHYACEQNNLELLEYLLSFKKDNGDICLDLEVVAHSGLKPIHYACRYADFSIVKLLVDLGVDLDSKTRNDDRRPLHYACYNKNPKIFKYLLQNPQNKILDMECRDVNGYRPIHLACENGMLEIVKWLNYKNVDMDCRTKSGTRPIHFACRTGHIEIVRYLDDNFVNMEAADINRKRPIDYAYTSTKNIDIIKYYYDNYYTKEHMTLRDKSKIEKLLRFCINNLDAIRLFGNIGIDIATFTLESFNTTCGLLHMACNNNNLELVKFLVEYGVDVKRPAGNKSLPIHFACQRGGVELIDYLLNCGKDLGIANYGEMDYNIIHWAIRYNTYDVVKYLLDKCFTDPEFKLINSVDDIKTQLDNSEKLSDEQKREIKEYVKSNLEKALK